MEKKSVSIQVPATSANCGAGYDTLGIACTLYNYFTYTLQDKSLGKGVSVLGEGHGKLTCDENNFAFTAFDFLWQKLGREETGLLLGMNNSIPLARGLGSSSSAIVAGLMAADYLADAGLSKQELLEFATEIEGHPDNVAPAIYGGVTISFMEEGKARTLRFLPARTPQLVAVIPDFELSTEKARSVIPKQVPLTDAVFNTSRSALFIGSLLTGDFSFLGNALEDKLHQPYRSPLIPGLAEAFAAARAKGAYNAIISGAGSTLMAYVPNEVNADAVGAAMVEALAAKGIGSRYILLEIDPEGAKCLK